MNYNKFSYGTIGVAINVLIMISIPDDYTSYLFVLTFVQFMNHTILVHSSDMTLFFHKEYYVTYANVCIIFEPFGVVHKGWYV